MPGQGYAWVLLRARVWGLEKARDCLHQLVKQEPLTKSGLRLQVELLARRKYAIGMGLHSVTLAEFQKMEAPEARVSVKEGGLVIAGAGCPALPAGQLPHPNGAQVFID